MTELVDGKLLDDVYEGDKKEKALTLFKDMEGRVAGIASEAVTKALEDSGLGMRFKPKRRNAGDKAVAYLKMVVDNNGVDPDTGERLTFNDLKAFDRELYDGIRAGKLDPKEYMDVQYSGMSPLLMPRVVTEKVREAVEPALVITPLLQKIRFTNGPTLQFPAVSSGQAGNLEIAERGEYPELTMQFAGHVTANVGKHGIKVSMTEEAIKWSNMDIWSMYFAAAGRALARHKEEKAVNQVFTQGTTYFNNLTVSGRKTTGRDATGAFNGTFTQDDLFDMYVDLLNVGYVPDLIVMNPMAFPIFMRDPVLRNLGYLSGSGANVISGMYQGSPANVGAWDNPGLMQQRVMDEPMNSSTLHSSVPRTFPFGPLRILVTPFVEFDRSNSTTDIYLCDSRDLGVLVEGEGLMTEEWKDPEHDYKNIKFREFYGIASSNMGRAVRKATGIVVAKAFDFSLSSIVSDIGALPTSELVVS